MMSDPAAGAQTGRVTSWGKRADVVVHTTEPFNAEAPPAALGTPLTDVDAFYSRNHGPVPDLDPAAWTVRVEGLVDSPATLTLADLAQYDEVTLTATLQCAGNRRTELQAFRPVPGEVPWGPGATSTATWTGVLLSDVLAGVGIRDGARHVEFLAPDVATDSSPPQGFGGSVDLRTALTGEVLLATRMNGQPLTRVHGAPVRVVVPGQIGARSVKWVDRVVVRADPSPNWFQAHAYRLVPADGDYGRDAERRGLALGPAAVTAAVLSPSPGATVAAGSVPVSGYAFAGDGRGVIRVDVSGDGGTSWVQAELSADLGRWAWRQWTARVDVAAGSGEIVARAWDASASTGPARAADVWNPKGYVNSSWARVPVTVG